MEVLAGHEIEVGGERYVLDFYIPAAALAIECHSFRWHAGMHDRDTRRNRVIRSAGIELLHFTWNDVTRRAAGVELDIRAAVARRTHP